ncbi:MAG: hypothetical protein LBE38_10480 [Deltaproteobacteria bacterium]|jgi:formamidopyrimidine-DNA glycosylase|nr:hypothetical protein [Deltaproteobacteria bacterium]
MPELPEAQTIATDLDSKLKGQAIFQAKVFSSSVINKDSDLSLLLHKPILGVERKGKMILFCFASETYLLTSLRMTGQFLFGDFPQGMDPPCHVRLAFALKDAKGTDENSGGGALLYRDIRKFGRLYVRQGEDYVQLLNSFRQGTDALAITLDELMDKLKGSSKSIKSLLMDQYNLAGLGNIYATEILFSSGVNPIKPASSLKKEEFQSIYENMRSILSKAIEERGSTVDNYEAPFGKGNYQNFHRAYGKAKGLCPICHKPFSLVKEAGRSTVFCPNCQK